MLNPKQGTTALEKWLIKIADEIEINLMLAGAKWGKPEHRSDIIAMVIMMWEIMKKQDGMMKE